MNEQDKAAIQHLGGSTSAPDTNCAPAPDPSNVLTVNSLQRLQDALRRVLYVHPHDLEEALVKACRENGYEIVSHDTMPVRRAFIQTLEKCGVVDFDKGEAAIGKNPLLDFLYFHLPDATTPNPVSADVESLDVAGGKK